MDQSSRDDTLVGFGPPGATPGDAVSRQSSRDKLGKHSPGSVPGKEGRAISSAVEGRAGLAEALRRRRTALGWTLEQVAAQAQVSVGMLSLIETGKRRPSLSSWERIRQTLGISEPLPEAASRQRPREISDELVATLGACLAAVRAATLAELAEATGVPISDVRLALRRLAEQLEPAGMGVLDDGSHVQLRRRSTFVRPSPIWSSPSGCPG